MGLCQLHNPKEDAKISEELSCFSFIELTECSQLASTEE